MQGFVDQVCGLYNDDLKFHNFHHAFTVFAVSAEVVRAVLADGTPRSGGRGLHAFTLLNLSCF
jgi:hypothetical protein